MPGNVVRAQLQADATRWTKGFNEAEGATQRFERGATQSSRNVANAVKGFLAFEAVSAVRQFAQDSIRAFSELEQSVGGTEAVFGDARGVIDEFAASSAQSIGLAESKFRTSTTLIGGQLKRMTGDVQFAAEQAVVLTQVGADLAATYGGTTAEAVDAFAAALRGEADPAERFNLDLKVSRVNAKAVELGLADSTTKVDDYGKAQALLALIMEQSNDAQGQFAREMETVAGKTAIANAELEDAKANFGEGLAPSWLDLIQLGNDLITVLDGVADLIGELTGESDSSIVSFLRWTPILGDVIRGIEDLADAFGDETESQERAEIGTGRHRGSQEKLRDALSDTTDATGDQTEATGELTEAEYDHAAAIDAVIEARRRATSPILQAIQASKDAKTAQEEYTKAVDDFGPGSDEAVEAAGNLIESQGELDAALAQIVRDAGPNWRAEFRRVATQADIAAGDIDAMIAKVEEADGQSATVTLETETGQAQDALDRWLANNRNHSITVGVRPEPGPIRRSHSGELIQGPPGSEHLRILEAGEEVISKNQRRAGSGGTSGGDIHIHIAGSVLTEHDLIEAIHRGLLEKQKSNGRLGFT